MSRREAIDKCIEIVRKMQECGCISFVLERQLDEVSYENEIFVAYDEEAGIVWIEDEMFKVEF